MQWWHALQARMPSRLPTRWRTLPFVVSAFALVFYAIGAAATVQWGDSAKLSQQVLEHDPSWRLGLGAHPLHTVFGIAFSTLVPWLSLALTMNLMSAFFGALTVGLAAYVALRVTQNTEAALVAAGLLLVAHTPWYLSSICESYAMAGTLEVGALALVACALEAESGVVLAVFAGVLLGISPLVNSFAVLFAPGVVWWALRVRPRLAAAIVIGGLGGGACAAAAYAAPLGWQGMLEMVRGQATTYGGSRQVLRELAETPLLVVFQFPTPLIVLLAIGAWKVRRDAAVQGILLGALCVALFAANYLRQKHFEILLGAYIPLAVAGGIVAATQLRKPALWIAAHVAVTVAIYALAPFVVSSVVDRMLSARPLPGRDSAYFLRPWKRGRNDGDDWARRVLREIPDHATVVSDFTPGRVLRFVHDTTPIHKDFSFLETDKYMSVEGVPLFIASLHERLAKGPVVFAQDYAPYYFTDEVRKFFALNACADLFCLTDH